MEPNHWRITAASVRGTSHEKTGQPCQDAHHYLVLPDGALLAAVADGAGSASRSEIGSAVAARAALDSLSCREEGTPWPIDDGGWHCLLTGALEAALSAVVAEASSLTLDQRDLATTLILMVATPECVACAQIGDGASVVGDVQEGLFPVTIPHSGEYINETTFLVSPSAISTAQVHVWRGACRHVALFSDGLQMLALKMPEGTPHAPFFAPLFQFFDAVEDSSQAQDELTAFLTSHRVTSRADDDLTLIIAVRM
jgi:serine/threonine protein phosphatase PrpC